MSSSGESWRIEITGDGSKINIYLSNLSAEETNTLPAILRSIANYVANGECNTFDQTGPLSKAKDDNNPPKGLFGRLNDRLAEAANQQC